MMKSITCIKPNPLQTHGRALRDVAEGVHPVIIDYLDAPIIKEFAEMDRIQKEIKAMFNAGSLIPPRLDSVAELEERYYCGFYSNKELMAMLTQIEPCVPAYSAKPQPMDKPLLSHWENK